MNTARTRSKFTIMDGQDDFDENNETDAIRPRAMTLPVPVKHSTKSSGDVIPDTSPIHEPVDAFRIPRSLRHSISLDFQSAVHLDLKNESKVLVLYTGGTIGMVRNYQGVLVPEPNSMEANIRRIVTMHDETYSKMRFGDKFEQALPLVLPIVPGHKRVIYTIYEYDPLLDSSNMTMDDWIQIAKDIKSNYEYFDGFVILHGTDTLAYTSSALSFMLENLGKPVIVTGSQIPAFETRSDGRDNLVGALIIAGNFCIPEVTVYFNHKLMRGNRTIKISSGSLHAFESPNLPPLATVGINIHVDYKSVWKAGTISALGVQSNLCLDVVLLRLFPSIRTETIKHFLSPPIKGVVLQCYGAGNMPSNREDIIQALTEATEKGVIIVSCTQCSNGAVSGIYETGKTLIDAGVIPGSDITPEAALTKLSYVLSKDNWDINQKRRAMDFSMRGEMTVQFEAVNPATLEIQNNKAHKLELIEQVARAMNLSSGEEMDSLKQVLFPSLLCSVVYLGDQQKLECLEGYDADFNACDYSGRTALHVAASSGQHDLVKWLLERGASVHVRDVNNETPLLAAVKAGHLEIVRTLTLCGAHLGMTPADLADLLVGSSGQGKVELVQCLMVAGADPSIATMCSGNTALHAAVEGDHIDMVKLLLQHGASYTIANKYSLTPIDIAEKLNRTELIKFYAGVLKR